MTGEENRYVVVMCARDRKTKVRTYTTRFGARKSRDAQFPCAILRFFFFASRARLTVAATLLGPGDRPIITPPHHIYIYIYISHQLNPPIPAVLGRDVARERRNITTSAATRRIGLVAVTRSEARSLGCKHLFGSRTSDRGSYRESR